MVSWKDYVFDSRTRKKEAIEWSITYAYDTAETQRPRVLLIGDSICNGYQSAVREKLQGRVNVSFWASSKCVTDRDYARELDFILDSCPYDLICFNNGLHSLVSDRAEWDEAYGRTVEFIQRKLPGVKLSLTLSTPLRDPELTAISRSLNETVKKVAAERELPVIDLFTAMDGLDREAYWSDVFHFRSSAIEIQSELISRHVLDILKMD